MQQTDHVFDSHFPVLSSRCIIVLQFRICTLLHTEVLKISVKYQIEYHHEKIEDSIGPNNLNPRSLELFFCFPPEFELPSFYCIIIIIVIIIIIIIIFIIALYPRN